MQAKTDAGPLSEKSAGLTIERGSSIVVLRSDSAVDIDSVGRNPYIIAG